MPLTPITYESLAPEYARLWDSLQLREERVGAIRAVAERLHDNRDQYATCAALTGVPWYVIAIIHKMEADCDFRCHLHNGDPLARRTVQVPAGRPAVGAAPFTWLESACDALTLKKLQSVERWTIERIAYELERYNGFGYRRFHPETLSPYLWSFSTHYTAGKYVADGKWSATAVSSQTGAMCILVALMAVDPTIAPAREFAEPSAVPVDERERLPTAVEAPAPDALASSRKLALLDRVLKFLGLSGGAAGITTLADITGAYRSFANEAKFIVQNNALVILCALALVAFGVVWLLRRWIVEDHLEGRYVPRAGR